ncbi:MAG: DNA gyrase subunit A [Chloroflexi bacterium]|nr:DNA gyrase subunit A [Chloroflexota bacterium]
MTTGTPRPVKIEEELRSSYLDYAMSVIVSRALPDVRDGLKPVQRRIMYAMHELGLQAGSAYKKSARIVGEVLGKYHPHGDVPVYDAMVRMAQEFSMRYPLIDGQGNFGSVDNDPPAAMRYTEARLAPIAQEMLVDIERETVAFVANFDGSLKEPAVLPARLPNLLINGATGIAVGMATSIPPHNLSEVCAAVDHLIDHPEATVEALMQFVQGPDFPTGACILARQRLRDAYEQGRGQVVQRAIMEVEELARGGRYQLVVTQIPYMINKAALVEKIAQLAKDRKIEGITDVRDESDRHGLRVVIELRRDAQVQRVKNNLFKHTALQSSFAINLLALVNGEPRTLSLKALLQHYIDFRAEVVRRRSEYEIKKAQARVHILEGLRIALQNLEAVIQLIRAAPDVEAARAGLMERFGLDEVQAQAILDMQLRRLAALERQRLETEYRDLTRSIAQLQALLADPAKVVGVVKEETHQLQEKYGDERRTLVTDEMPSEFTKEELVPHQEMVVTLSQRGYIKGVPSSTYRLQHRGGKGVRGQAVRQDDDLHHILVADTHDLLLFFTNRGRVYGTRVYELPPDSSRTTRGMPLVAAIQLKPDEHVKAMMAVPSLQESRDLLLATLRGQVKRMALRSLVNLRANGLAAIHLKAEDELISARLVEEAADVIMVSRQGFSIRFPVAQAPRRSRAAGGVRGMRLRDDDHLIAMDVVHPEGQLLVISQRGRGKPTSLEQYSRQSRGGVGLKTFRITADSGLVAAAQVVHEGQEIVIISRRAQVTRTSLEELRLVSRRTQGVWIVKMEEDDEVAAIACMDRRVRNVRDTMPRAAGKVLPKGALLAQEPSVDGHANEEGEQ